MVCQGEFEMLREPLKDGWGKWTDLKQDNK